MTLSPADLALAREYDLTAKFLPFVDRHLYYPLIELLESEPLYAAEAVAQLKFDLLKDTNMFKEAREQYAQLHPGAAYPQDLVAKEEQAAKESARLDKETLSLLDIIRGDKVREHLSEDKQHNRDFLAKEYQIDDAKIKLLFDYGLLKYNEGNYQMAQGLLYNFRLLSTDLEAMVAATWGYLLCKIFRLEWDDVADELHKLRDIIDLRAYADPATQLHHRTWVIHHYLFLFTNTENGLEQMCDLFFQLLYLSTIQAACPWILRYLVVAVVATKNHKRLRDLIRVVLQELYEYNDPLTLLVKLLYVDYDFAKVQQNLAEAQAVIRTDFFLSQCTVCLQSFLPNVRSLIVDMTLKVALTVDAAHLGQVLGILLVDETVAFVKDFAAQHPASVLVEVAGDAITVLRSQPSIYQTIVEKTKHLSYKSNQLVQQQKERLQG